MREHKRARVNTSLECDASRGEGPEGETERQDDDGGVKRRVREGSMAWRECDRGVLGAKTAVTAKNGDGRGLNSDERRWWGHGRVGGVV